MENDILKETLPEEAGMPELDIEKQDASGEEVAAEAVQAADAPEELSDAALKELMDSLPEQMQPEDLARAMAELSEDELANLLHELPAESLSNALTSMQTKTDSTKHKFMRSSVSQPECRVVKAVMTTVLSMISLILTVVLLVTVLLGTGVPSGVSAEAADVAIMDRYDMYMTNQISNALDGVLSIEKVYWLNDDDLIAPEPEPANYGSTSDPSSLQWLLDEASELLDIHPAEFVFRTDVQLQPGTEVRYYLDETIFAITWREVRNYCVYTFAEVKIAHASQFRRFLAGGTYGSDKQFITTQMASDVNAVLASSGDFYKFRNYGTIVYDGEVKRINSYAVDTCFIDDQGDMIMVARGEMTDLAEAQKFVDENNIRFSIAFGPILIQDGKRFDPGYYPIGEIYDEYPRAGLGQMGDLHYTVVVANGNSGYYNMPDIIDFADVMEDIGCIQAYTLDGGQTGVIAMDGDMINPVQYGSQRQISDIFYFATALPDGE